MDLYDTDSAVQCALETIKSNLRLFDNRFPDDTTTHNVYRLRRAQNGFSEGDNYGWTTSFWSGILWLAYELTSDETYRCVAEEHIQNFYQRIKQEVDIDTHDLGFLYTLSCVVAWRLTSNPQAKQAAIAAAEHLMTRYLDKIGIFQAWGMLEDPAMRGNTIVDSLMNMPLLYWASDVTGDSKFAQAAHRHATRLRDHFIRSNNTTFHTFYWDVETGNPLHGRTAQGYADDSCWARGQAWAIYGFTLNYRYTSDQSLLDAAQRCADYFIDHLPEDGVAYWDLVFDDASGQERDSSAAAIAVCGLQELANQLPDGDRRRHYLTTAETIMASLTAHYTPRSLSESNALLLHSVYDKPKAIGVDEGCLWGDYFYMEALTRKLKPNWKCYW